MEGGRLGGMLLAAGGGAAEVVAGLVSKAAVNGATVAEPGHSLSSAAICSQAIS